MSWRHLERIMQKGRAEQPTQPKPREPTMDKRAAVRDPVTRQMLKPGPKAPDEPNLLTEYRCEEKRQRLRRAEDGDWRPKKRCTLCDGSGTDRRQRQLICRRCSGTGKEAIP